MERDAKVTSKGQITVPADIRRLLGIDTGDLLRFEVEGAVVTVKPVRQESRFAKYRGIGNPGIGTGRRAINKWLRELRGE